MGTFPTLLQNHDEKYILNNTWLYEVVFYLFVFIKWTPAYHLVGKQIKICSSKFSNSKIEQKYIAKFYRQNANCNDYLTYHFS